MNAPLPPDVAKTHGTADAVHVARPARPRPPRRRRRRGQRESDRGVHNHKTERWMVSYADFITLLFAFFVVMYAMSSVNEGRYRVLSGALSTAFSQNDASAPGAGPVAKHDVAKSPPKTVDAVPAPAVVVPEAPAPIVAAVPAEPPVDPAERAEVEKSARRVQHMTELATRLDERLQALVRDGQAQVTRGAHGIAIEINAAVLFDPAKADLKPASFATLRSLAAVLNGFVEPLQIEGHSDDVPIATREFRSNWELSAARAASVGRFLIDQGVAPGRVGIAGYAEFRPLTANVDLASRARNRRVTLVVLSADDTRPSEGGAPAAAADSQAPAPESAITKGEGDQTDARTASD